MTVPLTFGNSGGPIFSKNSNDLIGVSVSVIHKLEFLNASFSVKSKHLLDLLNTVTDYKPTDKTDTDIKLEEQIQKYQDFIYLIEFSN
ncbi:MAG: hypothetical protein ACI85F_002697 [Bacteroidia bacterium]|jgi:hypothetical protein